MAIRGDYRERWQHTNGFMTIHVVTCSLTALSTGSASAPHGRLRWVPLPFTENEYINERHPLVKGDNLTTVVW